MSPSRPVNCLLFHCNGVGDLDSGRPFTNLPGELLNWIIALSFLLLLLKTGGTRNNGKFVRFRPSLSLSLGKFYCPITACQEIVVIEDSQIFLSLGGNWRLTPSFIRQTSFNTEQSGFLEQLFLSNWQRQSLSRVFAVAARVRGAATATAFKRYFFCCL